MFLISNGLWILQLLCKKLDFWRKKNLKKFSAEDRTGDLKVMTSLTRPVHQKNMLEIWAKKNALSSVGNYCSKTKAAGISNAQIFKSLRSASKFIWQVGNPNSFGMCSKVYVASFFSYFWWFFFKRRKIASPNEYYNVIRLGLLADPVIQASGRLI